MILACVQQESVCLMFGCLLLLQQYGFLSHREQIYTHSQFARGVVLMSELRVMWAKSKAVFIKTDFFILIIFCHFNMQISMKEQRFQFWLLIYVSGSTYMCFNPKWNGPSFILELAVFNLCGPKLRGGTARLPACCCTDRLLIWFGCPTTDPTPLPSPLILSVLQDWSEH